MRSFFHSRLHGHAPLQTVFWRDMVILGTGLNLIAAAVMVALIVAEAPSRWALAAYFVPIPWNLFIFFAVWRSAGRMPAASCSMIRTCAMCWLAIMLII